MTFCYAFDNQPELPNFIYLILMFGAAPLFFVAGLIFYFRKGQRMSKPLMVACIVGIVFGSLSSVGISIGLGALGSV